MPRRQWSFVTFVVLAHLAVTSFATVHHEMWRDELHCWLVARDSATPWQVIHARAYDGQPPLWYLLLWPLTRATWHPEVMRILHVAIAATNVALFARFAPFGRTVRLLFAFGYFAAYEYAAISRCYGLAMLFALLLCVNHPRRFERPVATGLLLAALALTTTVGTLVAAGYTVACIVDLLVARKAESNSRRAWIPIAFAAGGGLAAAMCAWPPADSTVAHVDVPPEMPWDFAPTRLVAAVLPIPRLDFFFWNSNLLLWSIPFAWARFGLALALFAGVLWLMCEERFAAILFGVGSALLMTLFARVYSGSVRHAGFLFVALIMGAWIAGNPHDQADTRGPTAPCGRLRRAALTPALILVLVVQLAGTAIAITYDTRYVFSSGARAAEVLRAHGLAGALLVAEIDYAATAMLGQLGPGAIAYTPRTGRPFSFVRWTHDRLSDPTDEQTLRFAVALGAEHRSDVVLVMNRPLLPELVDGVSVVRIAELYDSMIEEENFYLYAVKRSERLALGH
jgi:hypothetical protein